jgi:hypothetical protein
MLKRDRIAAVISAFVLSLSAITRASAALEQQSNERKGLNAKFADLVAKRDASIAEQRNKRQPRTITFDQAVAAT